MFYWGGGGGLLPPPPTPENSSYSNINLFDDLEYNPIYLKGNVENCNYLMGDFNSRTAKMSDNLLTETCMDSCDDFENELLIHAQALTLCNIRPTQV